MELVVFDLDGTLFNSKQTLSAYTLKTLELLADKGIAYTVATGRTLHAAAPFFQGHDFPLPQIYKNGALIWDPVKSEYSHGNFLSKQEVDSVIDAFTAVQAEGTPITPFVMSVDPMNHQKIYYGEINNVHSEKTLEIMKKRPNSSTHPLAEIEYSGITNISSTGLKDPTESVIKKLFSADSLATFYGPDMYKEMHYWMDIHHIDATKGGAIELLKKDMGFKKVICFGDSDNDISMFKMADECYAPENAHPDILALATEVIGHHDQDGIAKFLRQRFKLE